MRITVTTIDGTPEELLPQLREVLDTIRNDGSDDAELSVDGADTALSEDIARHITDRAQTTEVADRFKRFVAEGLSLSGVQAKIGTNKRTADGLSPYLMLHRVPRRCGAFVYVEPRFGEVRFRLTEEDIADVDLHIAYRNQKRAADEYQINCPVRTEEGLAEASTLLYLAYEKAGE